MPAKVRVRSLMLSANRKPNVHSVRTEKPPLVAVFLCPCSDKTGNGCTGGRADPPKSAPLRFELRQAPALTIPRRSSEISI
jgi:hypothetical protein